MTSLHVLPRPRRPPSMTRLFVRHASVVRVSVRSPHHALLLLRCCCMLAEDLLHLCVRCHVLVNASVDASCLAHAQLRLLVHCHTLAIALLGHPADARRETVMSARHTVLGSGRAHLLNMSVMASSSFCCAACMATLSFAFACQTLATPGLRRRGRVGFTRKTGGQRSGGRNRNPGKRQWLESCAS